MSGPDITVVTPAYNVAPYILATLQSLVVQTYDGWRCLVVDDGSTDGTAAIVSAFADSRVSLLRQSNAGVSRARNRGLEAIETPFVMFLDGDDMLHPQALERLRAGLQGQADAAVAFGALNKVLEDGRPYPGQKPLELARYPCGDVLAAMVRENFLANGGHVLARTDAVRRAGGFDDRLRLSEDWEFWCRLALEGGFHYIGAPPEVFTLRVRFGGASGGLAADWDNHAAAIQAVLSNPAIQARFDPAAWRSLSEEVWASHRWEAGRVNFTCRNFAPARRLMLASLRQHFTLKRGVLFALAQLSQITGRSLVSRLRFRDHDVSLSG